MGSGMRCSTYCTADTYKIDDLAKYLRNEGLDPKFYDEVIHIRKERLEEPDSNGDVFIFLMEVSFFLNFNEEEELQYLEELKPYEEKTVNSGLIYEVLVLTMVPQTTSTKKMMR